MVLGGKQENIRARPIMLENFTQFLEKQKFWIIKHDTWDQMGLEGGETN
jgi:hypothetical protein